MFQDGYVNSGSFVVNLTVGAGLLGESIVQGLGVSNGEVRDLGQSAFPVRVLEVNATGLCQQNLCQCTFPMPFTKA